MLGFQPVPEYLTDEKEHRRQIASLANRLLAGKMNTTLTVTLTPSAASTTVTDARVGYASFLGFMPQTAHAAAELATLCIPTSTQLNGSVVIQHANIAQADRTFTMVIIG